MTVKNDYDGTGQLGIALAALYGYSVKNQNKTAKLIKQAKDALGMISTARNLSTNVKLTIYGWHWDQLHNNDSVEIYSQAWAQLPVETISQGDTVEDKVQPEDVEISSHTQAQSPVEIISHSNAVELNSQYGINDLIRIAFYTTNAGVKKRQVIALEGFYLNALMLATGITKQDVPKWVQAAVDGWGAFDSRLPITKQVKLLLIRELTNQLERLKKSAAL
jgi:hypothetical protein